MHSYTHFINHTIYTRLINHVYKHFKTYIWALQKCDNNLNRQESLAPSVQTEMNLQVAQDDNEGDEYFEYADEEDEASTTLKDGETSGGL